MTAAVSLALIVAAGEPPAPSSGVWSADVLERQERFVASLEAHGLDGLLRHYYERELNRTDLTRGRRNWLRAGRVLLLERLADEAAEQEPSALREQAAQEVERFHEDNRPPARDDNYFVVVAYLARIRGERLAQQAAAAPGQKDLVKPAITRLRTVPVAVDQFRSMTAARRPPPRRVPNEPTVGRLTYLRQRADVEEGRAYLALAGLSAADETARHEALGAAKKAFERAHSGAPPTTRRGLQAALGKAAVLREYGDFEPAIALLEQVKATGVPQAFRRDLYYELILTRLRAKKLTEAIAAIEAFLSDTPPAARRSELALRVRLLNVVAHLRQAGRTGSEKHLSGGLALAHRLAAEGPRARAEILDILAVWNQTNPHLGRDDPLVQFARGASLFRRKRYAEAIEALETFARLPDSPARQRLMPDYWFRLGAANFRTKAYRQAGMCFERLMKDFPESGLAPESAYDATVAYENGYRVKAAREDLDAYIRTLRLYVSRFPNHRHVGAARWRLADALFRDARDWPAAAKAFEAIPPDDPKYWVAVLMIAQSHEKQFSALLTAGPERRADAARLVDPAVAALERFCALVLARRDWPDDRARAQARREAAQARIRLAQILMTSAGERHDLAFDALAAFERQFPDQKSLVPRVEALRLQARILGERYDDADRQLARILKTHRSDFDTLRALKGVEQRLDEALAAVGADAAKANALHRRQAKVYGYFVRWLTAQRGGYRTYVFDYAFKQADHLRRAGRHAEALPLLEDLERQNPDLSNVLEALADCYEETGKYDRAIKRRRRLVRDRERGGAEWFEAHYDVARLHLKRGRPKDGLRLIDILREGWPDFGTPTIKRKFIILERELEAAARRS